MASTRRDWLLGVAGAAAGLSLARTGRGADGASTPGFPGKVELKVLSDKPACLETPWSHFTHDFTPNDAFYVRWHAPELPPVADLKTWRLKVVGAVERPLELSMDDLRRMAADEVIAVNQCSGNSRAAFEPKVAGTQWTGGAMGNARWSGVGLAKILRRAGVRRDAVQVSFDGLDDAPPGAPQPDYVKSLDIDHALQPELTVATSMNGATLPLLNGFPARLIVPGWYATYWMKALSTITVLTEPYDGYWMSTAYRIPKSPDANEDPKNLGETIPINRMNIRSFFTSPSPGAEIPSGRATEVSGIAFDGGSGIRSVDISSDGGKSWQPAALDDSLGRFSFRRWRYPWTPPEPGAAVLQVRATSNDGQTQGTEPIWNRGGFMRNIVEELAVKVV